jgi:hypothetical protein
MTADLIARIAAQCSAFGGRVEGPTNVGALERSAYPIAIVYPVSDSIDNSASYRLATRGYQVQIVTDDWTELESLIADVSTAIDGYKSATDVSGYTVRGGKLTGIEGAIVQWSINADNKVCV